MESQPQGRCHIGESTEARVANSGARVAHTHQQRSHHGLRMGRERLAEPPHRLADGLRSLEPTLRWRIERLVILAGALGHASEVDAVAFHRRIPCILCSQACARAKHSLRVERRHVGHRCLGQGAGTLGNLGHSLRRARGREQLLGEPRQHARGGSRRGGLEGI